MQICSGLWYIDAMGIGKIELSTARNLVDQILQHVTPALDRVEVAGSIRRCKPVVGDLELVGIPADRGRLIRLLGEVGEHIKPGCPGAVPWTPKESAKYLRLRLPQEMNLDFFLGTSDNWGGLYMMRTGSAATPDGNTFNGFIPGIFQRWKKRSGGGRMTDCMPTTTEGVQIAVPEEQSFFDLLDMDFVPPEERISKGAIKKYARSK